VRKNLKPIFISRYDNLGTFLEGIFAENIRLKLETPEYAKIIGL
jgi:hypothetical protein